MMKTCFFLYCCCAWMMQACAQRYIRFRLLEHAALSSFADPAIAGLFGGISAMEPCTGNAPLRKNTFLLASDHHKQNQKSYFFFMDSTFTIVGADSLDGLDQVEALRYDPQQGDLFYSYEKDYVTGVGFIHTNNGETERTVLFEEPIPGPHTAPNRGIEGLCFSSDHTLWVAFESGGSPVVRDSFVAFYSFPFDPHSRQYDPAKKQEYLYPFDPCSCLDSGQALNGSLGNGVTEILAAGTDAHLLLVLERCFNGRKASVRLYRASVDTHVHMITKQLVFDFNDKRRFDPEARGFEPDNLEAMAWSQESGRKILYLMSDNNFSKRQRNQVVKLEMLTD